MKLQPAFRTRHFSKMPWFILIVTLATGAGMFVAWRAPNLNRFAQDSLMRTRGNLPEPEDIVIVAIDEPSIKRLGQFPWKRNLTAQVINKISDAQPKVIALDVLYSEATDEINDRALIEAIKKAGNVAIGEQLIEDRETPEQSRSVWLNALPAIKSAAAGNGHVNVETEQDGAARELLLKLANDEGEPRWALAVETVRIGDNLNADEVTETSRFVRIGTRKLPFNPVEQNLKLKLKDINSRITTVKPLRMTIDYIGATGSFAAQTVSFADVLDGKVSPEKFRGKYVLIGATAATMGDRIATPFVHTEDVDGDQHGDLMPGVEILANEINTILRQRFYQPVSDWTAFFLALLVAIAVLLIIGFAEGKFEAAKQIGALFGLIGLILLGSYLVYSQAFIIPPMVPMIVSLSIATPLALLRRSITASASFDERINELLDAENRLLSVEQTNFNAQTNQGIGRFFPRGLHWKTNKLEFLSRDLIARSLFVDRALRSLEDGLIIAKTDGSITFANQRAAQILKISERNLIGSDFFKRLREAEKRTKNTPDFAEDELAQLLAEETHIEREIIIGESSAPQHYILRLAGVTHHDNNFSETLGIVATFSDITKNRELERTKNDVIMLVTHELRTPLTAIQGMSELLTEHEIEPESQNKMLSTINSEAKRLARMVNEYLDITRLESGAQKARFAPIDAENVIEQTLLLLEPLATKRKIKFVRRFEAVQPIINADADLLARAMTNIVANALKYSQDKTSITIETRSSDDVLKIIVRDEGFGISAEQLPRIFEKFYRVPRKQSSEVAGTGLGLALTQEIIELHGGRIAVESGLNKGSTFTILLPIAM